MKIAKKKLTIIICAVVAAVIAIAGVVVGVVTCGKGKKDSIVIMSEELNGLFNPFYATTGADQEIIGKTQISMLSTDKTGNPTVKEADGSDKATVVKAFDVQQIKEGETVKNTVYTFVIKNGLKFSDGVPLTMNDILFNYYEYLDPVYTGSSTLYSTKIVGLSNYRTQTNSQDSSATEEQIASQASTRAEDRLKELWQTIFMELGKLEGSTDSYKLTHDEFIAKINSDEYAPTDGYKDAVANDEEQTTMTDEDYKKKLVEDYEHALETFMDELELDYKSAKDAYDFTLAPYSEWSQYKDNDIFKFLLYEGTITPNYAKKENSSEDDLNKIVSFDNLDALKKYKTEKAAIQKVYDDNVSTNLHVILTGYGTASTLLNEYTGAATDIIIHNNATGSGVANISGIVSLGHTSTTTQVKLDGDYGDGNTYTVAHEHNPDGTPKNENEYDVLQVTIEGADPKAIYSLGLTIAPHHYYAADDNGNIVEGAEVDIANNKFGVKFASSNFQTKVIQSRKHQEVPVGAGAYKASDVKNSNNPSGSAFWNSNIVYFKANYNFMGGAEEFKPKTEKIRYQVVSSANAISKLTSGEVDFVTPQYSQDNAKTLNDLKKQGYETLSAWQLGYGYIGINAGKIPDVNVRKAIMASMNTALALSYYESGTAMNINWPMSKVSWAYPKEDGSDITSQDIPTGKSWVQWESKIRAKEKIEELVPGGYSEKITFTIAGSSITEHPTYQVFAQSAELLKSLGWKVEVKADSQALTKLATGSLTVWAAAWGSTIDPDMYQVYHINSKATSVNAWGYREIKNNSSSTNAYEYNIIKNQLSLLIDEARTMLDQTKRKELYQKAMGLVLDLAVEMPVYQRKNLYAYNSKTITGITQEVNEYTSPLEKIWELELVK